MPSRVVIRGSSRLIAVPLVGFALLLVSAPVGSGFVRAAWVMSALVLSAFVLRRPWTARVQADADGILVCNIGRTLQLPWARVASVDVVRSDNVTALVSCLQITATDGSTVIARAASSYSRAKVERWRDTLLHVRP